MDAKLAMEASDTKIDHIVVIQFGYLCSEEHIFICVRVLRDTHDCHQFFQCPYAQLKESELIFKNRQRMLYHSIKVDFAFRDEGTASLDVTPNLG